MLGGESSLRRVLLNLGENAARYARTRIRLALQVDGSDVVLAVAEIAHAHGGTAQVDETPSVGVAI
jgi:K+-sensing histidine kinase KdpD